MKVALIHDWLLGMRGGERCLEVICRFFPQAELYTAFYLPDQISTQINRHQVYESTLNRLPLVEKYYRYLLPLYPYAARSLERTMRKHSSHKNYDLVLSISHCLAKNIAVSEGAVHLCYCLTPMRYIWDQYDAYFANSRFEPVIRRIAPGLREWDLECAGRVTHFVGISEFIKERIRKVYGRSAEVIYPPVSTEWISARAPADCGEGFLSVNALVPYKNVDLIVRAFNRLGYPLTVVGTGPERAKLERLAASNIRFLGRVSAAELALLYRSSKALVFAAEEDFGMTPVEMQAAGRPVICYGKGGVLETVSIDAKRRTGTYFPELSVEALCAAVEDFINRQQDFAVDNCLEQSRKFSLERFVAQFSGLLISLGLDVDMAAVESPKAVLGLRRADA